MRGETLSYPISSMRTGETVTVDVQQHAPAVDPTAWVDEHGDYLFRYAMMRLRDETRAEDAVQEALLAAIQSISSYSGKASERTWLTGILKHKIVDYYRRAGNEQPLNGDDGELLAEVEKFFERDDVWNGHWNNKLQPHNWDTSPEATYQESEFFEVLQNCLSKLPDRVAGVFMLREMDGLDSSEICEILSVSNANFWVMMHRARLALRRCIEVNWFRKAVKH
ncbi:MAG TPA: sigma-70 family RNA polymerase sigma factor [Pyrinomonadaceae bacterium]